MTKCKTCGAEIAKNAKVCVACGAKNKQPKWILWAVIAVVLIVVIASAGGNDKPADVNNNQPQEEAVIEYTAYTVSEMISDLEANALKAEKKYDNQYVEITGKLQTVDSDGSYISLRPADNPYSFVNAMCYIQNDTQLDKVLEMSTDDTVTLKGKVTAVGEVLGYSIDIIEIN